RTACSARQSIPPGLWTVLDEYPKQFGRLDNVFPCLLGHPMAIPSEGAAIMKIVVIGGTGLIGSKVVAHLRKEGHEVLPAARSTGVNTITGEGLAEALAGAEIAIDVANSPSFEDEAVMKFFKTAGRNLLAAEKVAGVQHHVALSVVGTDRLPDSGYLRAK